MFNAALIGGAICWGRAASHAKRDIRSSALFGAPMPLCFIIYNFFYLFFSPAPIRGALNFRAAPHSAGTVFCLFVPAERKNQREAGVACRSAVLAGWVATISASKTSISSPYSTILPICVNPALR
jgi:hypothetical protein